MTLDALIILTGAFVATLPFLGLPNAWDAALFLAAGIMVIALGIVVRRRAHNLTISPIQRDTHFSEENPSLVTDAHGQS